jgi:hypothetical protein
MTMIQLATAQEAIEPIEPALTEGLTEAAANWETLLTKHSDLALPLDTTARAKFIHNHACAGITQRTTDVAGVKVADRLRFFALLVGDEIMLRLKYVGSGAPRNYPTGQQKRLARQSFTPEMLLTLDGMQAPPTLLTCGYTLEGAEIGRIEIRRDCEGHEPWRYDIYGGEALAEPLTLPGMADTTKPAIVTSTRKKPMEGEPRADLA